MNEECMASRPLYPESSWFDPRLEIRVSPIHGNGVFATAFIYAGEQIAIAGGIVYSLQEWRTGKLQLNPDRCCESQIDDDLFLAAPIEDMDYFFNHSCDPNMWSGIARLDIRPDEEVTTDYAMHIFSENYCLAPCRCAAPLCRQHITGNDWMRPDLQRRYSGHFPTFIERRLQLMG
jgi:hypothetical protein